MVKRPAGVTGGAGRRAPVLLLDRVGMKVKGVGVPEEAAGNKCFLMGPLPLKPALESGTSFNVPLLKTEEIAREEPKKAKLLLSSGR